jgi:hypothetical protein
MCGAVGFSPKEAMNAFIIATTATLKLFAPMLAAAAAALGLSVLSRIVGQRKYAHAVEHVGGPWVPLHACITPSSLSAVSVPALDFQSYIDRLSSEDSRPREPAIPTMILSDDSAAMTLRAQRIYLDDRDVVEC